MKDPFFITIMVVAAIILFSFYVSASSKKHKEKLDAMTPEERSSFTYGPLNANLFCPHCQTKGKVHSKKNIKSVTSTGKIGGIVKMGTTSTTTTIVNQHHCDNCDSTWDFS